MAEAPTRQRVGDFARPAGVQFHRSVFGAVQRHKRTIGIDVAIRMGKQMHAGIGRRRPKQLRSQTRRAEEVSPSPGMTMANRGCGTVHISREDLGDRRAGAEQRRYFLGRAPRLSQAEWSAGRGGFGACARRRRGLQTEAGQRLGRIQ